MKINITTSCDGKNRDQLNKCEYYIALVSSSFIENDNCLGEMKDASALKKPMYALVEKKTKLPKEFFNYNWKAIIYWTNQLDFELASAYLRRLLKF
mgnify:CR=1 FL=1